LEFEWDEAKRFSNLRKHGVDFAAVERFDWNSGIEAEDARKWYGETRWRSLGLIDDRLYMPIYTRRRDRVRVISLRKASTKEKAHYAESKA
jgi:uncharacterized protein